ncbi:hypothetical protein BD311DRAFT_798067 [Dichomitus squalens]|uniref:Fungal-type protein kinase domain-containing protein n=1 Tax=Dichomitus squalens TaxID=114155 RepID=A0A4Q9MHM2_9APHY|nr:hypothetical protein BD311DRAFT_798067 [Dichomitus squalens]
MANDSPPTHPPDGVDATPRKYDTTTLSIGRVANLKTCRLQATNELICQTIKIDSVTEFLEAFLPLPSNVPKCPTRTSNPFETLKDADSMVESTITKRLSRKEGNKYDPFDDREQAQTDTDAKKRKASRGQIITYADLLFYLQHRVFLFMLLVIGRRFRVIRWGRSGILVTRSTDYYENPKLLCEFLWRISSQPQEALGLDPTATRLTLRPNLTNEMDDVLDALRKLAVDHNPRTLDEPLPDGYVFQYVLDMFAESIRCPEFPRYELRIIDGGKTHKFLVGKPAYRGSGALRGCVRGWVALDLERKRFVWLKDTWRPWSESIEKEGDVLLRLNKAHIEGVPTVVCHGDVEEQDTVTAIWWGHETAPRTFAVTDTPVLDGGSQTADVLETRNNEKKRKRDSPELGDPNASSQTGEGDITPRFRANCPLQDYRHYRLAEKEVCLPLKRFQDARQLVGLVMVCIVAHYDAAASDELKIHVLHRNTIDSHIMICPKIVSGLELVWKGLLIDWELSKPIVGPNERSQARQAMCCVDWQFTSVSLLVDGSQPVRICDDLESFLLILIYYAVRYLQSNLDDPVDVATFLHKAYDCYRHYKKRIIVGMLKVEIMHNQGRLVYTHPAYPDGFNIVFDDPALDGLIADFISPFNSYYKKCYKSLFDALDGKPLQRSPLVREGSPSPPPRKATKLDMPSSAVVLPPRKATDNVQTAPRITHPIVLEFFNKALGSSWHYQPSVGDRIALLDCESLFDTEPIVLPGGVRPGQEVPEKL